MRRGNGALTVEGGGKKKQVGKHRGFRLAAEQKRTRDEVTEGI